MITGDSYLRLKQTLCMYQAVAIGFSVQQDDQEQDIGRLQVLIQKLVELIRIDFSDDYTLRSRNSCSVFLQDICDTVEECYRKVQLESQSVDVQTEELQRLLYKAPATVSLAELMNTHGNQTGGTTEVADRICELTCKIENWLTSLDGNPIDLVEGLNLICCLQGIDFCLEYINDKYGV